ncbi:DUF3289 family protein [Cronobacter dublinensis]|uniref:DUF3289 family protein n=1 Tax=Cronobacter dublinensis TaxID=413497 RepID=UPI0009DAC9BD|nr:DUF3289 family protein [Cronobacter dublinensis]ELQ6215527.1 DUF3289 family protein [Cronobacter dublinensis]MDI6442484.1 DUF3289 family protein [Cronobacter dublinensis]NCH95198.1 DUF3289 family protein [Cronobacter dublinensis]
MTKSGRHEGKNFLFIDISQFQFFKAWFILQRYERFAYRPFFTDMQATVTLEGSSR